MQSEYEKYHVGDEIDITLVPNTNETKSELLLMTLKSAKSENFSKSGLKEGAFVNGTIKSIKDRVMFV
jgi:ribosomal protein S1